MTRFSSDAPRIKLPSKPSETEAACKYPPGLYLVATPIGNLEDITLRALTLLELADVIYCEDTRVSRKLLTSYSLKKQMKTYHDHNADEIRPRILESLREGGRVALISDAGTPLISDPGYKLVRAALREGFYVTSLPGANAAVTALTLSGLPPHPFCFLGFLPPKSGPARVLLEEYATSSATLLFYESPQRLLKTLKICLSTLGNRQAAVARELTKKFEEVKRGPLEELLSQYEVQGTPRGEIVLLIEGNKRESASVDLEDLVKKALTRLSLKEAVKEIQEKTKRPRKEIYEMALRIKNDG